VESIFHSIPISYTMKSHFKEFVFTRFTSIVGKTTSYKAWVDFRSIQGDFPYEYSDSIKKLTEFDPRQLQEILISKLPSCISSMPTVSIIIPVHNHLDTTLRCLISIVDSNDSTAYEIIIADDASTDNIEEVLGYGNSIKYFRNDTNLGFLRTCNKAVYYSTGQYLLFQNNDTIVLPEWLDNLVDVFNKFPKTGLVGSKLLYPDGRLQEAGGIIWENGSGGNVGRGGDPSAPEYNYLREVDYCSGASIMIPQKIWKDLGGFDEYFSPAYYEDTDLAFRVRKAGYKVFYQPKSRVIHFEGTSSGTDINTGIKQYQQINQKKFYKRWMDVLINHGTIELLQDKKVWNKYAIGQVLFVDASTPTPDQDSGSVDAFQYMKMFRQWGFEVSFLPVNNAYFGKYTEELQKMGIECQYSPYNRNVGDYIKKYGHRYNLVILSRLPVAVDYINKVRKYAPQAKIIFSTVDLHFLREKRQAELNGSVIQKIAAQKTEEIEIGVMRNVDRTLVVSDAEYQLLRELYPDINVSLVTIPREIPGCQKAFKERRDIVFIGGFRHQPNIDAVEYFVSKIWPIVSKALPEVQFIIVGGDPPDDILKLSGNNIVIHGRLEKLGEVFDHCRLSVAPLRFGAGVKGKVVTSLSYGVPCVATDIANEGMGLVHGRDILLANSEGEFAGAVVDAYTSAKLWNKLSRNGLKIVGEKYSMERVSGELLRVIQSLGLI
jgi:GT2 family glycosyltransferase/glycosyltransferase involved in cell wall biosynthesis